MSKTQITTLETARILDEAANLLGEVARVCEWLRYTPLPKGQLAESISGIFGIMEYAANAANCKLCEYQDEFMSTCGFTYPLNGGNAGNCAKDMPIPLNIPAEFFS